MDYEVWQVSFLYDYLDEHGQESDDPDEQRLASIEWGCPEAKAFKAGWDAGRRQEGDSHGADMGYEVLTVPTTVNAVKVVFLQDGYSSSRGLTGWYRYLTVGEAKRLSFSTVYAIDKRGMVRECRLNCAPKTWKTRPGCVLSLKYGLREHFRVGSDEAREDERLSQYGQVHIVVPVRQQFDVDTPPDVVTDWVLEHEVK